MTPDGIDEGTLKALLSTFEESKWEQMAVSIGGDTLQVSRGSELPALSGAEPAAAPSAAPAPSPAGSAAPAPAPGTPEEPAPAPGPGTGEPVTSPTVGIFWHAPSPGAPPFVAVGARVEEGDTIGIVEVMKLMNHVTTDVAGTVTEILVPNGDPVEFGQVLIRVEP